MIEQFASGQRHHFEDGFIEVEPVLPRRHLVDEGPDPADDVAGALAVLDDTAEGGANLVEIGRLGAQPAQGGLTIDIVNGNPAALPITVVPFAYGGGALPPDTDIAHAHQKAGELMASIGLGGGGRGGAPLLPTSARLTDPDVLISETAADATGGYWPSYLFADGEVGQKVGSVSIPMGGRGGGGGGGRAHAANEFYTIESIGKAGGLANAEKNAAAAIYQYAQLTTVAPKPKTSTPK